jgi:acetyl esterase/lipase
MNHFFSVLFFVSFFGFSQVQIDTTYTLESTFNKELKKYPFIKKVHELNDNDSLVILKEVLYESLKDKNLYLDFYSKKDNKLHPAVVLIHGGGWKSGNKSQMHALAQQIALNGYSCFCVEYRLTAEAKYPAAILDIKKAITFIKSYAKNYNVNPNKIAVLGCSSGGQMAALVGTTNGNSKFEDITSKTTASVQAIIDMDGILAFHHPESQEGKTAALWLGGDYQEASNLWEEASAINNCDINTPPVLFINSSIPRFHAGQDDMIKILEKNGIYYEVKILPNAPHSFWFFHPWFEEIVNSSTQFLDKIFKD